MDLKQLEYFVEVSKKKSFNKASEQLYIAPQSLSRSISSMENELGFSLMDRSNSGIKLTRDGEKFLKVVNQVMQIYKEGVADILDVKQKEKHSCSGNVMLFAHSVFAMSVLPHFLTVFCKEYPNINVCLLEDITSGILQSLQKTTDDVENFGILTIPVAAVKMQEFYKNQKGYYYRSLGIGEYLCCVSKDSELAKKKSVSLKKICEYPMVRFTSSTGSVSEIQSFFLEQYGTAKVVLSTTSISAWISAIQSNIGIGLIHNIVLAQQSSIKQEFDKIKVLPIVENTALEIGLLLPRQEKRSGKLFEEFLVKYFAEILPE